MKTTVEFGVGDPKPNEGAGPSFRGVECQLARRINTKSTCPWKHHKALLSSLTEKLVREKGHTLRVLEVTTPGFKCCSAEWTCLIQQGMPGVTEPYALEFYFNEGSAHSISAGWISSRIKGSIGFL